MGRGILGFLTDTARSNCGMKRALHTIANVILIYYCPSHNYGHKIQSASRFPKVHYNVQHRGPSRGVKYDLPQSKADNKLYKKKILGRLRNCGNVIFEDSNYFTHYTLHLLFWRFRSTNGGSLPTRLVTKPIYWKATSWKTKTEVTDHNYWRHDT